MNVLIPQDQEVTSPHKIMVAEERSGSGTRAPAHEVKARLFQVIFFGGIRWGFTPLREWLSIVMQAGAGRWKDFVRIDRLRPAEWLISCMHVMRGARSGSAITQGRTMMQSNAVQVP